jgi:hypothetical protein
MARYWGRGDGDPALERRLRAERPQPSVELERSIAARCGHRSRSRGRIGLVVVLTAGMFAALAGFGGVGYAVSSVKAAVDQTSTALTPSEDQYGTGGCTEYVNPHGQTIPPAGLTPPGTNPKGGENPDGFYLLPGTGTDTVTVTDLGSGTSWTFPGGSVIKYTQSPGATPTTKKIGSDNGEAGAVLVHVSGTGDFQITLGSLTETCLVPPPPK